MSKTTIKAILGIQDSTVEALLNQAASLYSDGDHPQMRKLLRGVIALAPDDPRPHTLLGSSYLLEGRDLDAERAYSEAYTRDSSDPYTLVALGELKLRSLQLEAAVMLFKQLFEHVDHQTHPAAIRAHQLLRDYYQRLGGH